MILRCPLVLAIFAVVTTLFRACEAGDTWMKKLGLGGKKDTTGDAPAAGASPAKPGDAPADGKSPVQTGDAPAAGQRPTKIGNAPPAAITEMQMIARRIGKCVEDAIFGIDEERSFDVQFEKSGSDITVNMLMQRGLSGPNRILAMKRPVPAGFDEFCKKTRGYNEGSLKKVLKAFLYTPTADFKEFNLVQTQNNPASSHTFAKASSFKDFLAKIEQFPYPEGDNWPDKLVTP